MNTTGQVAGRARTGQRPDCATLVRSPAALLLLTGQTGTRHRLRLGTVQRLPVGSREKYSCSCNCCTRQRSPAAAVGCCSYLHTPQGCTPEGCSLSGASCKSGSPRPSIWRTGGNGRGGTWTASEQRVAGCMCPPSASANLSAGTGTESQWWQCAALHAAQDSQLGGEAVGDRTMGW